MTTQVEPSSGIQLETKYLDSEGNVTRSVVGLRKRAVITRGFCAQYINTEYSPSNLVNYLSRKLGLLRNGCPWVLCCKDLLEKNNFFSKEGDTAIRDGISSSVTNDPKNYRKIRSRLLDPSKGGVEMDLGSYVKNLLDKDVGNDKTSAEYIKDGLRDLSRSLKQDGVVQTISYKDSESKPITLSGEENQKPETEWTFADVMQHIDPDNQLTPEEQKVVVQLLSQSVEGVQTQFTINLFPGNDGIFFTQDIGERGKILVEKTTDGKLVITKETPQVLKKGSAVLQKYMMRTVHEVGLSAHSVNSTVCFDPVSS